MKRPFATLLAAMLFVSAGIHGISSAAAQDWPNKPVRIVNTFAPGGAADYLARTIADDLSTTFGQQFFVETRSGAAGAIGVNSVVATPPDGYNFVITNITMLVLAPISNPKLGYHPERDLTNIAYLGGSPVVLSVNSKSPIKTLADFIALREEERQAADLFVVGRRQQRASVRRDVRPQGRHQGRARALQGRGAGPARSRRRAHRVVGADRDVVGRADPRRHAARHRAHVQAADGRTIRTCRHSPSSAIRNSTRRSGSRCRRRKGLPRPILGKMNGEINKIMTAPAMVERMQKEGMVVEAMTPAQLAAADRDRDALLASGDRAGGADAEVSVAALTPPHPERASAFTRVFNALWARLEGWGGHRVCGHGSRRALRALLTMRVGTLLRSATSS